jgi:hypothetical protein
VHGHTSGVVDSYLSSEVAQVVMTGRLPPRPRGPLVGGAPVDDKDLGGITRGTMSVGFCIYRLGIAFCIG